MSGWTKAASRALAPTLVASLTSTAALALLSKAQGRGALLATNATSHWLNGRSAAKVGRADWRHTGVGATTHVAATFFWAVLFERWLGDRAPRPPARLVRAALVTSGVAAAVDYLATPKRFTPGWEFVLTPSAMAAVYVAMAAGLAAGARRG